MTHGPLFDQRRGNPPGRPTLVGYIGDRALTVHGSTVQLGGRHLAALANHSEAMQAARDLLEVEAYEDAAYGRAARSGHAGHQVRVNRARSNAPDELERQYHLRVEGTPAQQRDLAGKLRQGIEHSADLCQITPSVCMGNLGIPRAKMPQLDVDAARRFVASLRRRGITVHGEPGEASPYKVPVGELRATQREIHAGKVLGMLESFRAGNFPNIDNNVLVVDDPDAGYYILDGHHRWATLLVDDPGHEMRAIVIEAPIRQVLDLANRAEGVQHAGLTRNPPRRAHRKGLRLSEWKRIPFHRVPTFDDRPGAVRWARVNLDGLSRDLPMAEVSEVAGSGGIYWDFTKADGSQSKSYTADTWDEAFAAADAALLNEGYTFPPGWPRAPRRRNAPRRLNEFGTGGLGERGFSSTVRALRGSGVAWGDRYPGAGAGEGSYILQRDCENLNKLRAGMGKDPIDCDDYIARRSNSGR